MGIQINGNNDIISALDGSWTAEGASINTSGILTATTFEGNVTGTACTFVDGKFTGNETIGGTLSQTVTGAVTENYNSSLRTNISGTTGIKHTGVATYHYSNTFQERIEKEHEVTKLSGTDFDNFFTETSRTEKDPATEIAGL